MLVGKTGHAPSCKQDDINALMVSLAKAGRRVVRLKGGDPMIFGRADEEIAPAARPASTWKSCRVSRPRRRQPGG
jgi:uroporphyrin-III C-methyltransferase / precorrin-2 dehydrogenase / sirohydrochlorin ferrochelatase